MFCGNCGKKIPDDSMFCPDCGTPVKRVSSQSVQKAEAKNKNHKIVGIIAVGVLIVLILVVLFSIFGGGSNYEKKLVGEWYSEDNDDPEFIFYSDGTCEIDNWSGACKWNVVNDDQLKLTDIWGESRTSTIESIKNNCLTLRDGDRTTEYYKNGK